MKYLIRFEDNTAIDPSVVGHKFASLARAKRSGFNVPLAFAIQVEADDFFRRNNAWPEGLQEELQQAAQTLDISSGVSARSSSTQEDLEGKSFAGQYETFLDIRDENHLTDSIQKCWESASSQRVSNYLDETSPHDHPPLMAVVIQRMVHAKAAGVAFSRNPMYPLREEVVVEAVPGLGEKLVSGHVTPCRVFVRKDRILMDETAFPGNAGDRDLMKNMKWGDIARMARQAEIHAAGQPQDIEWAIDVSGKLWLLQSRPITTIKEADLNAPPGTWTRKIAEDLWADRLTPFLADVMMRNAPRFDLSKNAGFLKMPLIQPGLSVINGFLYVNCDSLKAVLALVPQKLRISELRSLFPPGFEIDSIPSPPFSKLFRFAARSLCLGLIQPQGNPLLCRHLTRCNLKKLQEQLVRIERLPHATPAQALIKANEFLEILARLQENNQWPYLYATLFTWALRWLVKDLGGLAYSDFLHLLSANTDNITTRIEHELRRLAQAFENDEAVLKTLLKSPEALVGNLPRPLQEKLHDFLIKYGCRSRHRTLYLKRWVEAPEEVLGMVAALVGNARYDGISKSTKPAGTVQKIRHKLPRHLRLPLLPLLRLTCSFLNLREDLRFFLDQILYRVRESLLTAGKQTGLGEDVLFVTQTELEQLVEGKTALETARRLAVRRRNAFLKESDVATYYIDGRPMDELPSNKNILYGIGTSPGRATGRARIVDDPTRQSIQKGDILVAKNTDPGWTPILRIVSGIVVEEGGILNHCSIVAREMGIPAVVGVRQATRKIPEDAIITIDGGLGAVQMAKDGSPPT